MIKSLLTDERGATAIEYALLAALVGLASVIAFKSLGLNLLDIFNGLSDTLAAALH